jgi:aerobic carbon-monoxide dehydrogenase medium subunit
MIPEAFSYSRPTTIGEALTLLEDGSAKALAGGMSLIPMMKLRLAAPEHLVDLSRVAELNSISEGASGIRIGATVTHYEIESSALLRRKCPLLSETAGLIGDAQVRNAGTIGGSVAHADPSSDYPGALFALGAIVHLRSATAQRQLPYGEFLRETFTTALEPGEIIEAIEVPAEDTGTGSSYQKLLQPASGFAVVGVAARIRRDGGKIGLARIGVTGLGSKAFRATGVETLLTGTPGKPADIQAAAAVVADGIEANTDIHASAAYRSQMARVYAARAIQAALTRAA